MPWLTGRFAKAANIVSVSDKLLGQGKDAEHCHAAPALAIRHQSWVLMQLAKSLRQTAGWVLHHHHTVNPS